MAKGAGAYPYRFTVLRCTRTTSGTTGDRPRTYAADGYLWGNVETTTALEQTELGAVRHTVIGTVYIRNFPTLSSLDRLSLPEWGETYAIDGVRWGDNELICDVHRLDVTE